MALTREQISETIDAIDAAILDAVISGVGSYSVSGGASYTNLPLDTLRAVRGEYALRLYRMDFSMDGTTVRSFPQWVTPYSGGR